MWLEHFMDGCWSFLSQASDPLQSRAFRFSSPLYIRVTGIHRHYGKHSLRHWEVVGRYPPSHTKCAPEHKDCDHPAKRSSEPFWERPLALHWARFFFLKALERDLYPNYYVGTRIPPRTDDDGPDKMEATKLSVFLYPKSFCPLDHEYYALDRQLMELCEFAIEHQLTLASERGSTVEPSPPDA